MSTRLDEAWCHVPGVLRWATWIVVAYAVVWLRRPETLTRAEFYVEDGQVFYLGTFSGDALGSLIRPYAGYLHLLPRSVAVVERLVSVQAAPLVANAVALLVPVLVAAFIASDRLSGAIPRRAVRWALAALVLVAPNSHETLGSMTYVQFYLSVFLVAVAAADAPRRRAVEVVDLGAIVVATLTTGFAILLAPLYWGHAYLDRRPALARRALAFTIPATIQLLLALALGLHAGTFASAADWPVTMPNLLGAVAFRFGDAPFLGALWTSLLVDRAPVVAIGAAVAITTLVVVALSGLPRRARLAVAYMVAVLVIAGIFRALPFLDGFTDPGVAERYVIVPAFVLTGAVLVVALGPRGTARTAALALIAVLTLGVVADLRLPPRPYLDWPVTSACIGGPDPCDVPVNPAELWTLRWPGSGALR